MVLAPEISLTLGALTRIKSSRPGYTSLCGFIVTVLLDSTFVEA